MARSQGLEVGSSDCREHRRSRRSADQLVGTVVSHREVHQGRGPFAPERRAMPKSKDTSALAFVGQIQTEHKAVLKADGEALKHAIECGKYLNLAKENVLAAKGKWTKWREDHIPEISQQTASLYMRLAENEERVAECESIREADVELRKPRDSDDKSDSTETESDEGEDEAGDADDTNNALL